MGGTIDFGQWGANYGWIQSRNAGDYSLNYSLLLNPNGGNVGIGTTSPGAKLDIRGSGDFLGLQVGNGTVGALFQVNGGNAGFVGYNGSAYNSLDIRSGIGTQLFLSTNGNVGIGTNSPAYTIDTSATARAKIGSMILGAWSVDTNYAFFGSSGFDQTVAGNYGLIQGADGTFINTPTGGHLGFRRNNGDLINLPSSGGIQMFHYVGITSTSSVNTTRELSLTAANTTPQFGFTRWDLTTVDTDVIGRILFTAELSAGGSGTERNGAYIEAQAAGTFTSTNSPGRLVFYTTPASSTTPSERMNINSDGNVRIGTGKGTAYLHLKAGTASANTAPIIVTGKQIGRAHV